MIRLIVFSLFLCEIILAESAFAKPDDECAGIWSLEIVKDENYTPYHEYSQNPNYPVKLKINKNGPDRGAIFTDNLDRECSVAYFNDEDGNYVVFRHCLRPFSPNLIPTHYKIQCSENKLIGKIVSYKDLFKLEGVRAER